MGVGWLLGGWTRGRRRLGSARVDAVWRSSLLTIESIDIPLPFGFLDIILHLLWIYGSTQQGYLLGEHVSIRKTSIEIDGGLLEEVRRVLGTRTLRETVEQAFLAVLRERARREEIEALSSMDGMDLDDPEVMASAWRD
ncbi:MAG: hypothetical protein GEU90_02795 [Gemmatimonas sp.]|nr:hypothetical protein [Gemmatimonas sp.]